MGTLFGGGDFVSPVTYVTGDPTDCVVVSQGGVQWFFPVE